MLHFISLRVSYLIILLSLTALQTLQAVNLTKLILKEAYVQNTTDQNELITVLFHQKCARCPRLHNTYERTIIVPAGQNILIKETPHIIRNIKPTNQAKHINLIISDNHATKFTFDHEKKEDFPLHVDFDTTLKNNIEYEMLTNGHEDCVKSMPEGISSQTFFDKIKKVYEKNNLTVCSAQLKNKDTTPKIPRSIHTIWFEGKQNGYPMYEQFKKWQQEWQNLHPSWTFTCWNEALINEKFPNGLYNQKIFNEARMMSDYASMSKILRYEILDAFGGLYIDPDMKCYESFAPLHQFYDFYAGLGTLKSYGAINNSIIGAKVSHPIIKACMEQIKKSDESLPCDNMNLYNWTARNLSTQVLTQFVYEKLGQDGNNDIIFPRTFFDGNAVEKEFYHTQPIYEAAYEHMQHKPEAFCSRGIYSYVPNSTTKQTPKPATQKARWFNKS